jgi:hypothetical protein
VWLLKKLSRKGCHDQRTAQGTMPSAEERRSGEGKVDFKLNNFVSSLLTTILSLRHSSHLEG